MGGAKALFSDSAARRALNALQESERASLDTVPKTTPTLAVTDPTPDEPLKTSHAEWSRLVGDSAGQSTPSHHTASALPDERSKNDWEGLQPKYWEVQFDENDMHAYCVLEDGELCDDSRNVHMQIPYHGWKWELHQDSVIKLLKSHIVPVPEAASEEPLRVEIRLFDLTKFRLELLASRDMAQALSLEDEVLQHQKRIEVYQSRFRSLIEQALNLPAVGAWSYELVEVQHRMETEFQTVLADGPPCESIASLTNLRFVRDTARARCDESKLVFFASYPGEVALSLKRNGQWLTVSANLVAKPADKQDVLKGASNPDLEVIVATGEEAKVFEANEQRSDVLRWRRLTSAFRFPDMSIAKSQAPGSVLVDTMELITKQYPLFWVNVTHELAATPLQLQTMSLVVETLKSKLRPMLLAYAPFSEARFALQKAREVSSKMQSSRQPLPDQIKQAIPRKPNKDLIVVVDLDYAVQHSARGKAKYSDGVRAKLWLFPLPNPLIQDPITVVKVPRLKGAEDLAEEPHEKSDIRSGPLYEFLDKLLPQNGRHKIQLVIGVSGHLAHETLNLLGRGDTSEARADKYRQERNWHFANRFKNLQCKKPTTKFPMFLFLRPNDQARLEAIHFYHYKTATATHNNFSDDLESSKMLVVSFTETGDAHAWTKEGKADVRSWSVYHLGEKCSIRRGPPNRLLTNEKLDVQPSKGSLVVDVPSDQTMSTLFHQTCGQNLHNKEVIVVRGEMARQFMFPLVFAKREEQTKRYSHLDYTCSSCTDTIGGMLLRHQVIAYADFAQSVKTSIANTLRARMQGGKVHRRLDDYPPVAVSALWEAIAQNPKWEEQMMKRGKILVDWTERLRDYSTQHLTYNLGEVYWVLGFMLDRGFPVPRL